MRRGVGDGSVDGRAQLGVAHVHTGVAQRLFGRLHGGFGGPELGRVLVELRLADGVDAGQRHGAVVIVARFERPGPGGLQLRAGREHRGRELRGVDREEQLPAADGHPVGEVARGEEPIHAGLDHGVEVARQVTDDAHAVGNRLLLGADGLDPQWRNLPRGGFPAPAGQCGQEAGRKKKSVHNGMFLRSEGIKKYTDGLRIGIFPEKKRFFGPPDDGF